MSDADMVQGTEDSTGVVGVRAVTLQQIEDAVVLRDAAQVSFSAAESTFLAARVTLRDTQANLNALLVGLVAIPPP